MSLARTALRLAAVEALNADPTIAILCLGNVYDSRIGNLEADEPVPVITVYTEDDAGEAFSSNNGGPPFDETCELLLEIAMRAVVPGSQDGELGIAESDRELEALVDLLEARSIEALTIGDTPQSRLIRQKVTRRAASFKSMRFTTDDTGIKLAIRMVNLTVELKGDDRTDATTVVTGPYAALPEPLRSVARSLPDGSSAKALCDRLNGLASGEAVAPLSRVDVVVAPRPSLDPKAMPERPPSSEVGLDRGTFGITATLDQN